MSDKILLYPILMLILLFSGCPFTSNDDSFNPQPDQEPVILELKGPTVCFSGQAYTYEVTGYDPDGTKVSYHFGFWNNDIPGSYSDLGWSPFVNNNVTVTKDIDWPFTGDCVVCSYCKDQNGKESPHVQLEVTVTKKLNLSFDERTE